MTRLNLSELLRDQLGSKPIEVTATISVESIFDPYELADCEININDVLARRGAVALIWHIADVQLQRPDLTDTECWDVLQDCLKAHAAGAGSSWRLLTSIADRLFDPACNSGKGTNQ